MGNKTLITSLRKSKGWTQEHLAEIAGLSVRTIQRLESGEDASLETLRIVAEALGVSVPDLFEHVEDVAVKEEIVAYDEEQLSQQHKRKTSESLFNVFTTLFYVAMFATMAVFGYSHRNTDVHPFFSIGLLSVFLISLPLRRYLKLLLQDHLNDKYPLTKSLLQEKQSHKRRMNMWWEEKPTRYVISIFWGTVVPLLFILKFVLHVI